MWFIQRIRNYVSIFSASRLVKSERISECHQNGCEEVASQENFGRSIKVKKIQTFVSYGNNILLLYMTFLVKMFYICRIYPRCCGCLQKIPF